MNENTDTKRDTEEKINLLKSKLKEKLLHDLEAYISGEGNLQEVLKTQLCAVSVSDSVGPKQAYSLTQAIDLLSDLEEDWDYEEWDRERRNQEFDELIKSWGTNPDDE